MIRFNKWNAQIEMCFEVAGGSVKYVNNKSYLRG